jgi:AraC-like DNA-binding protein
MSRRVTPAGALAFAPLVVATKATATGRLSCEDELTSVLHIATKAGLSVYQFEQRVQRLFQMSPLQLLHKLRLDEATRLLRETDLPLGEIALQTGWCDQSAFTRHFSRYAGMAPGKFRSMQGTK